MRSIISAAMLTSAFLTQTARADGLIYQLPPDGTGVRYDTEVAFTNNNGEQRTFKGSLTISSVGSTTVDGAKCRWIEFKSVNKGNDGQERITIAKCLVPEEHLTRGKSPGDHMVRGWVKQGDREPQEIKDTKSLPGRMMLAAYLAGPPPNLSELDKAEIDGKFGKLACAGVTGNQEFQRDNGTLKVDFENRLHEKAPFGVVSAVWKFERQMNGQTMGSGTTRLALADVNTTALTELPDRN